MLPSHCRLVHSMGNTNQQDNTPEGRLCAWIAADVLRMRALTAAASLALPDWCIAAGFVRNLVWDRLHGYQHATPLSDIDLIYFDRTRCDAQRDNDIEAALSAVAPGLHWSVKNQARMYLRNGDPPYRSTEDAMSHWPEVETAVGVRLDAEHRIAIVAPFGLDTLFNLKVTPNPKRPRPGAFAQRLAEKRWLSRWPRLSVNTEE